MATKPQAQLEPLMAHGPYDVLRGDLALVGLPGVVYTPRGGLGLPGIAFGHGWMQPPALYRGLLRHLASWGIVTAAPATQRGPLPSHRLFATDLETTLRIITSVRLGPGGISVDPERLGLAGHSTGAGAAILAAAAGQPDVQAVASVAPAETVPSAIQAGRTLQIPGLHLAAAEDLVAPPDAHARAIAAAWGGPVQLRSLAKSTHLSVTEGMHWTRLLLHGKPRYGTQRLVRGLFTAFFLRHLAGESEHQELLDGELKRAPIELDRQAERTR
ncbi:chlorophyllase/cutinase-like alpha/beta fold protein [Haloechinothrix sp. LS1_15]|uniref:dienelactone hydrolase family protein n=1 Tax=Haloechinothrix sp. LS1_15 TaxID=2652248 RepID=UPI0029460E8D|nr:alpha/beta hydrolase [Haloechinothrix sp. LS1_15]MDV6013082.1 alpha/beta hydrolase [Haloechinothrix sp. LS1_15]